MSKTILFDLDGTVTDSGPGIMNCVEPALQHYGISVPSRDTLRAFVGPPLRDTFVQFGVPVSEVENAIQIYRSRYLPVGIFENTPYPGIQDTLIKLRHMGHTLCIATSKPESMARTVLDHFGLTPCFDRICGATLDQRRDTKESVIGYLLEQEPSDRQLVMVGDTRFDVLGAAHHGVPTVGVTWGYGSREELQNAGAIAIVDTMEELIKQLQ